MGLNSIAIDARLVRDAEVRTGQSQKEYTNMRVVFDRWNKMKREREPNFISVRVFKAFPAKKGQAVVIRGELEIREYEKDGVKQTWPQILAHEVFPIQYQKMNAAPAQGGYPPQPNPNVDMVNNVFGGPQAFGAQPAAAPPAAPPSPPSSFEDDIIPF